MGEQDRQQNIETSILQWIRHLDRGVKVIFISVFLWGLAAHGMALFNKFSFHDDARYMFDLGLTYSLGRWFLADLGRLSAFVFQSGHFSLPLFQGLISFLCLALSLILIARLLDLRQPILLVLLSGVMVMFPMVAGLFNYMFSADYYMIGLLLGVAGVCIFCRWHRWYTFLIGAVLLCCSIGTYQAFLPVALGLGLFYCIHELDRDSAPICNYNSDETAAPELCRHRMNLPSVNKDGQLVVTLYVLCALASGVVLYLICNQAALGIHHVTLSDYQGVGSMGQAGLYTYLSRMKRAFLRFFWPSGMGNYDSMFPQSTRFFYLVLVAISAVLCVRSVIISFVCRSGMTSGADAWILPALRIVLYLFVPVVVNFIFVMCDPDTVHSLMGYGQALSFVWFACQLDWLLQGISSGNTGNFENTRSDNAGIKKVRFRLVNGLYLIGLVCFLLADIGYCRYDNICHQKAQFMQARAVSWFTALIGDIKAAPGYRDEYPVAVINEFEVHDQNVKSIPEFEDIHMLPLWGTEFVLDDYSWKDFVNHWCAYSPEWADASEFEQLPEVEAMPSYPDAGSIKVINDTVVVKF